MTPVAIATIQKLQNFALQPMESSAGLQQTLLHRT